MRAPAAAAHRAAPPGRDDRAGGGVAGGRDSDLPPLPGEQHLWATAALGPDRRRNLRDWTDATRTALVRHYLPLAVRRLARHTATLAYELPADEVESQAAEWVLKALRRYDPACGPSFAAYLVTMLDRWVHDLARASSRSVNETKVTVSRTRDAWLSQHQHEPRTADLIAALGGDAAAAARRLRALALRDGVRHSSALDSVDIGSVAVRSDGALYVYGASDAPQPGDDLLTLDTHRSATAELAQSAWHGDGLSGDTDNTSGLWAFALTHLDGHSKHALAAAAQCHTRRVNASINALLDGTRARLSQGHEGKPRPCAVGGAAVSGRTQLTAR